MTPRPAPYQWSMAGSGNFYITRERNFDATDRSRFSGQKVSRAGRLGTKVGQVRGQMTVSADGGRALVTLHQGHPDLMMIGNFR